MSRRGRGVRREVLTHDHGPGDMPLIQVGQQHQPRDEEGVVEPDEEDEADAEPPHGIGHEVQPWLHAGALAGRRAVKYPEMRDHAQEHLPLHGGKVAG